MKRYQHTQRGTVIVVAMLVAAAIAIAVSFLVSLAALPVVAILLITAWLFHSFTIEISESELRWHFGPGLISKRVPLSQINSVRPVRTAVWEGWGIHLSRFGWLYNVSGKDAVAVTLKTGKRFALGTDEPQVLANAIGGGTQAIG